MLTRFIILTFHRVSNDIALTVRIYPSYLWGFILYCNQRLRMQAKVAYVYRCINIPVVACATFGTNPRPVFQCQIFLDISATRTSLAAWFEPSNKYQVLSIPFSLVDELPYELIPCNA